MKINVDGIKLPCKSLLVMNASNYINAKGKEIIVCKGGWKISREKMESNKAKRTEESKAAARNRLPYLEKELSEAIADNEPADFIKYLQSKVEECKMAMA